MNWYTICGMFVIGLWVGLLPNKWPTVLKILAYVGVGLLWPYSLGLIVNMVAQRILKED